MIIQTDKPLRKRDPNDFYPTPIEVCRAALNLIPATFDPLTILDPGAGTGVWGEAAHWYYINCRPEITGFEMREVKPHSAYDYWRKGDFLTFKPEWSYDLAIGNPPYKFAEKFVRRSIEFTRQGGYLLFLLRLAFLEGQDRGAGLWRDYPPQSVHVLSARPSFIASGDKAGKTDSTAYAIFVWQKGWTGQTTLGWLNWKQDDKVNQPALFEVTT